MNPNALTTYGDLISAAQRDVAWAAARLGTERIADRATAEAAFTNALGMAIDTRLGKANDVGTIIHSDQGVQFGSWAFTKRARDSGLLASMGSIGDCYDNSMIESFWSRMQVELLDRKKWNTRLELANAMFHYLEIWHNRQRRHSQLGWLTPVEFERNRIITVA